MFCHKCGNQLPEGSGFCHKCGAKLAVGSTSEQVAPTTAELGSGTKPAPSNNTSTPAKTGGLRSVFRIGRNILVGFAILLALFSFLGIVGLIIGIVVVVLIFAGWRMTVAEKNKEGDNAQ